jgi:hypothetical protein
MALTNKLSAIGDAIREKTGKTDLMTLDEMPVEIASITTGGGGGGAELPEEAFIITGDCERRFGNDGWSWFVNNYGNRITTKDITKALYMFSYCNALENIPFTINFKNGKEHDLGYMFSNCKKLKQAPLLKNVRPSNTTDLFIFCEFLREIPENYGADWDWSYIDSLTSSYSGHAANMFAYCRSLRKLPMDLYKHVNPRVGTYYTIYYQMCNFCCTLDEVVNLPVPYTVVNWVSNAFSYTITNTYRLKNFTFATNDDGTPVAVQWKSQTLDLSSSTGYASSKSNILNYNSGITADKEVKDDATYQALKNDPDWFSCDINYSRYNHDSAVATINSLPDTSAYLASAGGTNTIKFKGACGSKTDGGAISNLTAEEIAVATARGWTVSLV